MAEAKPVYLYSTREDNRLLKDAAANVLDGKGVKLFFDREYGAYELKTDGLSKDDVKAIKAELKPFMSKAAKDAWQADRLAGLAGKDALRNAARGRESTTPIPKPEKAPVPQEQSFLMFPSHSQKDEFRTLVRETNSMSRFIKGNESVEPHYSVKTEVPERFAVYMGDEAKERFVREHAERNLTPRDVNTVVERVRDEAARRSGSAFMAQYKERGFRLRDGAHDQAGHAAQLNDMRVATTAQLLAVIKKSREIMMPLRDKEAQMRADAAGLSVEQVKAMSWADQKVVGQVDGKPIGLVGDEFKLNGQLSRGIAAINAELNSRGIRQKSQEKTQEQAQDRNQQAGKSVENAQQVENKGYTVSQESSVDNDYAVMAAGFNRRGRGAGR